MSMSDTVERPKQKEPDLGRCLSLIGHACKAEHGFNALAGRFMHSCHARDCPVRSVADAPALFRKPEPLPQPSQGGGLHYRPPARKRR